MASKSSSADISSSVSKLTLETSSARKNAPPSKSHKAKKAPAVADSWEDEDVSSSSDGGDDNQDGASGSDDEQNHDRKPSRSGGGQTGTAAPPPTPMSPTYGSKHPFSQPTVNSGPLDQPPYTDASGGTSTAASALKRPEKTDAVARRMIASALGVKVPKMTEEQKKYDQAMRDKERRRREEERELQRKKEEEAAKAKQAVWED